VSYHQRLVDVFAAEVQSRDASSVNLRIVAARFPERKTLADSR
jgi:hypothetical protein